MSNKQPQIFSDEAKGAAPWHGFKPESLNPFFGDLVKQLDLLQRSANAIKSILADAEKKNAISVFTQSDAVAVLNSSVSKLEEVMPGAAKELVQLQSVLGKWSTSEASSRKTRFEAIAKRQCWNVVGNWPEPVVEGIVFVVVDEKKNSATVNDVTVSGLPTAELLAVEVYRQLDELRRNVTDPAKLVTDIWRAYKSIGGKPDDGVLVFDLLKELVWMRQSKRFAKNPTASLFKDYPTAQFRADLTSYLSTGSPLFQDGSNKYSLDIVGGSYAENGLYMYFPQTKRLATCGRLTFRST